ncbi:MAG: archaetidylserine decarboxylase [Burkholderiales bacterium]|jgi:phosphatidylserine decarboxylase
MSMTSRALRALAMQEDLNFLLTNRIPRIAATRLMGRFSGIRSPLLARASIAVWRLFTDLDLDEAVPQRYESLQQCFTRALRPGARPVCEDPGVLASPSDGIVGELGRVVDGRVYQAKGFPYSIAELLGPRGDPAAFEGGTYVTLRLTSAMYHRFHAPHDCTVERVTHLNGDTWNVNPIALRRVERLFCRNERAAIELRLSRGGHRVTLVPIAAILVASIRLHFADLRLHVDYDGPETIVCDARLRKGEEMGWFEHGSTIVVFAPEGFEPCEGVATGRRIRMGEPLLRCADAGPIG